MNIYLPSIFLWQWRLVLYLLPPILNGFKLLALILLILNVLFYVSLWWLFSLRLYRFKKAFLADFFDFTRGIGFFTIVAATCVLGAQINIVLQCHNIAFALWLLGLLLWPVILYSVFTCFTIAHDKPALAKGINGGWLVAVVACQGVSLLGSQLAGNFQAFAELMMFIALFAWVIGGMLYLWLIALIFYRSIFLAMEPKEYSSPYWINMGAVAI